MGKGDKRGKNHKLRLPAINPAPRRTRSGRISRAGDTVAAHTAIDARLRHFGGNRTRDALKAATGPHMGHPLGMVAEREIGTPQEVNRLWTVFREWCSAEYKYRAIYLGLSEFAKCAAIMTAPDRTDSEGSTYDNRSEDDRAHGVKSMWAAWQKHIKALSRQDQIALRAARLTPDVLWRDAKPTRRGHRALSALRRFARVVEDGN